VGVLKAPPVSVNNLLRDWNNSSRSLNSSSQVGLRLVFNISPVAGLKVSWSTTLRDTTLYVDLPQGILPDGSKESLVTLLEYAEEKLKCDHVVVCVDKGRSDRVSLLRVFNFFGFTVLPPGHKLGLSPAADRLFMAYAIERDSDDSEEDDDDDDEDEGDGGKRREGSVLSSRTRTSSEESCGSEG